MFFSDQAIMREACLQFFWRKRPNGGGSFSVLKAT